MARVILNRINIAPVTIRCMTSLAIEIMGIYCRNIYVCDLVHEKNKWCYPSNGSLWCFSSRSSRESPDHQWEVAKKKGSSAIAWVRAVCKGQSLLYKGCWHQYFPTTRESWGRRQITGLEGRISAPPLSRSAEVDKSLASPCALSSPLSRSG